MFFFLQPASAKILPFRAKAKSNLPTTKLSDVITRCCQKCCEYGNRLNGFVIYERLYIGRPDIEPEKGRPQDFVDVDVCRQCFDELCPDLAKFNN